MQWTDKSLVSQTQQLFQKEDTQNQFGRLKNEVA